jgi:hypothetical protein
MSEAFFEARGPDRFQATELTRGPWDPGPVRVTAPPAPGPPPPGARPAAGGGAPACSRW